MISKKSKEIMEYFSSILPNASCELTYHSEFELLIAVMLSAQTTDKKVNECTKILFNTYKSIEALSKAELEDLEAILKPLGLFHNKAVNVLKIASIIHEKYHDTIPHSRGELESLPGVGRKTVSVIKIELWDEQEFPVDTHIARIAKRLGYATAEDDVLAIEKKLKKSFPKEKYKLLHHQFIHFGRYYCMARNPTCLACPLKKYCHK